ncbi:MAG: hypothetical protein P4K86_04530 [Terracidiphilus sp.]|nr:hypothetical protein [Terracidiphilus sp.]
MRRAFVGLFIALMAAGILWGQSAAMPMTPGETIGGKRIVLAEAVSGHTSVLVMSFSRAAGNGSNAWARSVRADSAMAGVSVYQVAMLEKAPGLVRGVIRNGLRKGLTASEQDNYVILTQDEKLWRSYFSVTAEKDPYVELIDATGRVRWHGHGEAKDLEPLLKAALK